MSETMLRRISGGIVVGLVAGMIPGVLSRLAMRLIVLDAGGTGEFTLVGTAIIILSAMGIGGLIGMIYILIVDWLPGPATPGWHGFVLTALVFMIAVPMLMFGMVGSFIGQPILAQLMFYVAPPLYGWGIVGGLAWLEQRNIDPLPARGWRRTTWLILIGLLAAFGLFDVGYGYFSVLRRVPHVTGQTLHTVLSGSPVTGDPLTLVAGGLLLLTVPLIWITLISVCARMLMRRSVRWLPVATGGVLVILLLVAVLTEPNLGLRQPLILGVIVTGVVFALSGVIAGWLLNRYKDDFHLPGIVSGTGAVSAAAGLVVLVFRHIL